MKTITYFLSLLVVLACLGCGRSKTYTGPDGETTTVTQKGDSVNVTVHDKDGKEVRIAGGVGVPLPDGFPKDVAIYPKATVITSTTAPEGMNVALKTSDSPSQVEGFYKANVKDNGWTIESSMNMPQGMMLHAKKDGRALTVVVADNNGETQLTLSLTEDK